MLVVRMLVAVALVLCLTACRVAGEEATSAPAVATTTAPAREATSANSSTPTGTVTRPPSLPNTAARSTPTAARATPAATLDVPPAGCQGPRPRQVAPYFAPALGASPFWASGFVGQEATLSVGFAGDIRGVTKTAYGWTVKVLMALEPQQRTPVTVRVTDVTGATPVWIAVNSGQPATTVVLDPQEPAIPVPHGEWKEYPSYWYIAKAGCYALDISWPDGAARVTFAAGR